MTPRKDATAGSEAEFQPGSRGRVLSNFLGITRVAEMEAAEALALAVTQTAALKMYGRGHRFKTTDIRRLHRMWLGAIYPWAGSYRTVHLDEGGLPFTHVPLIAARMAVFGTDVLGRYTPCGGADDAMVVRSLARVHAELILIHPFRDGNARLARLMTVLMATQAGLTSLRLSALAGTGKRTYAQAIQAAMKLEYAPLESLFAAALDGPPRLPGRGGCPN